MQRVRFEGASGSVQFEDASSHPDKLHHGERRNGISYSLLNYNSAKGGGEGGFVEAGIWTPCEVQSCSWIQRWSTGVPATFPGGGRDPPMQTGECRYGEVRSESGSCVCGVGFRADDDGGQCVPCPLFTSSAEGEGDCDVCAAGRCAK